MVKKGDKVTYKTEHKTEQGIVKRVIDKEYAFVVYHCGGDWENYEEYTAAKTRIEDLQLGWGE